MWIVILVAVVAVLLILYIKFYNRLPAFRQGAGWQRGH